MIGFDQEIIRKNRGAEQGASSNQIDHGNNLVMHRFFKLL